MARPLKPFVRGGGYYPSNRWTPLVYPGGYTTANGGGQPEPEPVLKTVTGSLIHITDALALPAEALTVNVEPIQDLHGYDSPWPGGRSKNLIPDGTNTSNGYVNGQYLKNDGSLYSDTNWYTSEYFSVTAGETYTWSTNGNPNSPSICFYDSGKNYISSIQAARELPKTFTAPSDAVYCRASQGKVFVTDGQQIELGSTATTPKPYSNICPISGYDNATIYSSRYNMIDQNVVTQATGWAASTDAGFTEYNGATVYKGEISNLCNKFRYYNQRIPVKVQPGKRYIVSVWWRSVSAHTENGLKVQLWYDDQTNTTSPPMTANQEWTRIALVSSADKIPSGIGITYNNNYQIYLAGFAFMDYDQYMALGDDGASFVCPNDRTTYTIQLGDTVYGGTVTLNEDGSADMVVTKTVVDLSTLSWNLDGTIRMRCRASAYTRDNSWAGNWRNTSSNCFLCIDPGIGINARPVYSFTNIAQNYYNFEVRVPEGIYTDGAQFRTWLSDIDGNGTHAIVCIELATPFEITLTPTQIEMLLGENNLWADAGDSTLTYYAEGNASTSEALGILLGGTYNNPGGADDVSDDEALGILLGGS